MQIKLIDLIKSYIKKFKNLSLKKNKIPEKVLTCKNINKLFAFYRFINK